MLVVIAMMLLVDRQALAVLDNGEGRRRGRKGRWRMREGGGGVMVEEQWRCGQGGQGGNCPPSGPKNRGAKI